MKRTPLLFLLCLTLLFFGLFHFDSSKAENEFSNEVLVHERFSQEGDKLRRASQEVKSSKSAGANFERRELFQSATVDSDSAIPETNKSDKVTVPPSCFSLTTSVAPGADGNITRNIAPNCSGGLSNFLISNIEPVGPVATNVSSSAGPGRVQGTDETFARLITKAKSKGPVRVIVGVKTAFRPEGLLQNAQLVQFQREGIAQAQESLIAQLMGFNAHSITRFTFIPFIAMELDAAGLTFLQNSPRVSSIEEDLPRPLALAESVPLIGGTVAWASGFSGAGQTVAILDTGVDKTHSFLSGKVVSEACYSLNNTGFTSVCPGGVTESTSTGSGVNCSVSMNQDCKHGTHVAGIAAGKGASFSGVARDANIIAIQVFSQPVDGGKLRAFDFNMAKGLERVQQLSGSFNIAAVNISIGDSIFSTNCDNFSPMLKAAIENLRSIGIATVVASGNGGITNGISFPACFSSAISVGSTDDGSVSTTVDTVSDFSNSASFLKLLAPGRWINSSVPGGGFENFPGTSMAAPHVTGAWAILKSKVPSATVDQVLQALTSTGLPVTDSRNGITKPRIKVDAALNALGGTNNHVLTIASSNPNSGVSITVSPNDDSNLGNGTTQFSRTYNNNTTVNLTAPATAGGNNFQKWQRNGVDWTTNPTTSVLMDANYTMTAVYVTPLRTLTVASTNPASGVSVTVSPTDNSGFGNGVTQFSRTYNLNTIISLAAPATAGGNSFLKWQRDGQEYSTNLSTSILMDADHTMTAVYGNSVPSGVAVYDPILKAPQCGPPGSFCDSGTLLDGRGNAIGGPEPNQPNTINNSCQDAGGSYHIEGSIDRIKVSTLNDTTLAPGKLVRIEVTYWASSTDLDFLDLFYASNANSPNWIYLGTFQPTATGEQVLITTHRLSSGASLQVVRARWSYQGSTAPCNMNSGLDHDDLAFGVGIAPPSTLTVASTNPSSGVSITVSPNDNNAQGSGTTQFNRTYNNTIGVNLTAPPTAGGNNFHRWQRNGEDWTFSTVAMLLMDDNYTMTAVYVTPRLLTLTVASVNPASGVSITVSPTDNSGLSNGTTQFSRSYNFNKNVNLTAPATVAGKNFQKWQRNGVDWSTNRSTSVVMNTNITMTAVYGL